ncbi:MAG: uroporphyrinogen decarboxylase family protein [Phycisphaerae bacterium]|jgi:uroporphyrinogen decarboxylase
MPTSDYKWKGPVKSPPDFENIVKVLKKQKPNRDTLFEFYMNPRIYSILADSQINSYSFDKKFHERFRSVLAFRNAGYDFAVINASDFYFPVDFAHTEKQTISLNRSCMISDWKSFETYKWPDPDNFSYDCLENILSPIDGNMKLIIPGPYGVLETTIQLMGYNNLCYSLVDKPDLVKAVCDAIGQRLLKHYQICLKYESVGAIFVNDDWGFKTQTMMSPDDMKKYITPWHKKFVACAHHAGRYAVMHSCGNLKDVMDVIIDDIGFDGKHSYEDTILPVEDAYEKYNPRIAIVGGIDLDFIVRSTPQQVYTRSAKMLERTRDRGGYALGTGNSVPEYVPDENYFAMILAAVNNR